MILIADFDDERRNLLMDYIQEDLVKTAVGVTSTRAMVAKLREFQFELLIVNFDLPDMNGKELEFLKQLRARFTPLELPIILLESEQKPDSIAKAMGLGCNDCITLPMKVPIAIARVRNQITLTGLMKAQLRRSVQAMASPEVAASNPIGTQDPMPDPLPSGSSPPLESPVSAPTVSYDDAATAEDAPSAAELATKEETLTAEETPLFDSPGDDEQAPSPLSKQTPAVEKKAPHLGKAHSGNASFRRPLSLLEWIHQLGNAAEDECLMVLIGMASALAYAHKCNYIHREINSETVTVFPDKSVLINGVGVGTQITAKGLRGDPVITNPIRGMPTTPIYAAPEQLKGLEADHRADIYTFGNLAYEILSGRPPFYGLSLSAIVDKQIKARPVSLLKTRAEIDLDLETLIFKCFEKDPAKRYQTAETLVDALKKIYAGKYQPREGSTAESAPKKEVDLSVELKHLIDSVRKQTSTGRAASNLENLIDWLKQSLGGLEKQVAIRIKNMVAEPAILEKLITDNLNRNNAALLYSFFKELAYNKAVILLLNHFNRESDTFKKITLGELAVLSAKNDLLSLVIFGLQLGDSDAQLLLKAFGEVAEHEQEHIFLRWAKHRGQGTQMILLKIISTTDRPEKEVLAILELFASGKGTVHPKVKGLAQDLLQERA